jgi:multicomponent Na+:H+ antiporter subunit D
MDPLSVEWSVWIILLPFAAGTLAFLGGRRLATGAGLFIAMLLPAGSLALALQVWRDGPQRHAIGGWGAPLGIELHADGLSCLMLLMTSGVGLWASVYARGYFSGRDVREHGRPLYFWPLWLFLWAALNALFLSADVFNLYVALELIVLAAVALVALGRDRTTLIAGMRYLMAALLGSLAYLLGVAFLYAGFGTLDVAHLNQALVPGPVAWTAIALITLGLALKAALFPLHFWLPPAHAHALGPVSAVLSGLVIKAAFYVVLRLWFDVFVAAIDPLAAQLPGLLGAGAIVWGSLLAIRQSRLKLLVAYSTVAQVGYLFVLFPLATAPGGEAAWSGGVYQALSHAAAKAAMFMAAANLLYAYGHDRIAELRGCAHHLPLTVFSLALAGVSLMGLPPSGGFVAKWLLLQGALQSGQWWYGVVVVVGGLLAAGYVFPVLRYALMAGPTDVARPTLPFGMELAPLALAAAALVLGVAAALPLALLQVGAPAIWELTR